jgi:hypothetical protein
MALAIKRIMLWRAEVDNRPGALATTLEPVAKAGVDLTLGTRRGSSSARTL